MHAVGFDPGGEGAFGWAVLGLADDAYSALAAGTCTGASAAADQAAEHCPSPPIAFGVDAPLFWVTKGDRIADRLVRQLVVAGGGRSSKVSHVNSLRGACLVQGVLVLRLAHARWPNAAMTEAHPKALLAVSAEARRVAELMAPQVANEHERDAVLAAFAALSLARRSDGWHDLAGLEREPFFPGGAPVAYWFPKTAT